MYRHFIKRLIDILVSFIALVITSPVLLVVAVINFFSLKGSPIFFQERPGRYEKSFRVIKFKSMNNRRDEVGNLLPDNQRITRFGLLLRKTSIDELPQLINVIAGDMSLIGPRPLLFRYLPLYNETQKRRHEVRPGITGWAQVNGRNAISWQQKFALDVYYVDNVSFLLDIKICWLTIVKVLMREGVNQGSDRPMNPFTGNN